jgi:hypothetical protein
MYKALSGEVRLCQFWCYSKQKLKRRTSLTLANNQLDALFSMYLFISLLYMFRATQCSSSGELNCINTSSGVYITDDVLMQFDSLEDGH